MIWGWFSFSDCWFVWCYSPAVLRFWILAGCCCLGWLVVLVGFLGVLFMMLLLEFSTVRL